MASDPVTPAPEPGAPRAGARVVVEQSGTSVLKADRDEPQPTDERWTALLRDVVGHLERDLDPAGPLLVSLAFVGPAQMAELNLEHLGHQGPTDVLSFPIDGDPALGSDAPATAAGEAPAADPPPWLLGDIVICPEVAAANAEGHAGSYPDEIALLIVHGVLHLLGMDHAGDDERDAMQAAERRLLAAHHGPLVGDPWAEVAP